MLSLLGLTLPILYLPGAEEPYQWFLLAVALPVIIFYSNLNDTELISPTIPFYLGAAFLIYYTTSLAWTYSLEARGSWYPLIWGLSFLLGGMHSTLRPLWRGLAIGLAISTGFAILQSLGFTPVLTAPSPGFPGLLFNPTISSAVCALTILALVLHNDWAFLPGPALGLILSGSRGGWLILALGLAARYLSALSALCLLLAAAVLVTYHPGITDSIRLQIWVIAYRGLTLLGWGPGIFDFILYNDSAGTLIHPQFAHNDYLQLAFEYGLGAIPLLAAFALALFRHRSLYWPLTLATAALAAFWFPLYHPITAFIAFAAIGHISRDYAAHPLRLPAALERSLQ